MRDKQWDAGFLAGVLSALACVGAHGDDVIYREIVATCGAKELLREAIKQGDIELPRVREAVKEINRLKRVRYPRAAADPAPQRVEAER